MGVVVKLSYYYKLARLNVIFLLISIFGNERSTETMIEDDFKDHREDEQ